jgi:predicted nucleic acid-binding protein
MRIFLDANVLVSVVNKEYPAFTACARVLSLADRPGFILFTSSLSLAITWYFAEKKHGRVQARKKIENLLAHIQISDCGPKETGDALRLKTAEDFEDALQYFSALNSGCQTVVTSNTGDFHFSVIPVFEPDDYLRALASGKV